MAWGLFDSPCGPGLEAPGSSAMKSRSLLKAEAPEAAGALGAIDAAEALEVFEAAEALKAAWAAVTPGASLCASEMFFVWFKIGGVGGTRRFTAGGGDFGEVGDSGDGDGDFSQENNTPVQPSKKYFNYTTLRELIENYPVKKALKPAEVQKGD